jgi:hypothetical protein
VRATWRGSSITASETSTDDKELRRAYRRDHYRRNKELYKQRAREHYQKNKERLKLKAREWREKNPERVRQMNKDWKARNPEKVKVIRDRYYQNNREMLLQKMRDWEDTLHGPGYSLRRKGFRELADHAVERAGGKCERCGVTGTQERGKSMLLTHYKDFDPTNNVIENIVVICLSCHMSIHHSGERNHFWVGESVWKTPSTE